MKKALTRLGAFLLSAFMLCAPFAPEASAEEYSVTLSSASLLSKEENVKLNKSAIKNALDSFSTEIKITGNFNIGEISEMLNSIIKDYRYFYVNGICEYYAYSDGRVTSVRISYATSKNNYEKIKDKTLKKIKSIVSSAGKNSTDLQKIAYFHDYIITNCVYTTNVSYEQSPYGVFVKGKASCEGYSKAFQALCTAAGIECDLVESESMVHMWNIVKLDGKWYHIDVTYDDPVLAQSDIPPTSNGQAYHTYFLKSDSGNIDHSGWNSPHKATSVKYDNVSWKDSVTPFAFYGKNIIFSTSDGKVNCYDLSKGSISTLTAVKDKWQKDINASQYVIYNNKYIGVSVYGGYLYYNTSDSVMRCDLKTGKTKTFCRIKKSTGLPVGMTAKKKGVYCYFAGANESDPPKLVAKFEAEE